MTLNTKLRWHCWWMWRVDPVVITLFFEVPSLVIGRSSWVSTIPSRIPTRLHRGTCTLGYLSLVWTNLSSNPLEVINGAPLPVGHLFPGRCPKLGKLLISSSHQSARSKHNFISSQFSKAFRIIFFRMTPTTKLNSSLNTGFRLFFTTWAGIVA